MDFAYTAKSNNGQTVTGVLAADGELVARQQLREQGLFVVSLNPGGQRSVPTPKPQTRGGKVNKRELLTFTTQLAIMTRAGIDPASALESVAHNSQNPKFKPVLQDVLTSVESGRSVSDGLRRHPKIFDMAYTASVAAGEVAGRLPDVLGHLVQLQQSEISRSATVRGLVTYPLLLCIISGLVITGLVCFVLPEFASVFNDMDMPLPAITRVLLDAAGFVQNYSWLWGPILFVGLVGMSFAYRSPAGRELVDRIFLYSVLLRDICRSLLVGRTFRLLGMLIESGVPILEAVQLVGSSVKNQLFRRVFKRMEEDLLNGNALSHSFSDFDVLPPETGEMVLTAERTGTLGMVTMMMGEHYEQQGEGKLRDLSTILEPTIVVGMGFLVGTIILAVMLPMFDMATIAKG